LIVACSNKLKVPDVNYHLELNNIETMFFEGVNAISKLFYYFDENNDKEYLIYYDKLKKYFIIFNYVDGSVIKKFNLGSQINSIYIKNIDSIYVSFDNAFGEKANIFGIINSDGEILERLNFYNVMVIPEIDSTGDFKMLGNRSTIQIANNPYSFNNFCIFDEKIYMNIVPKKNLPNKYDYPTLAFANIYDKNYILKYGYKYPKSYNNDYTADYIDFVIKKDDKNITNIIISYVLSDSIYINRLVPIFEANDISVIDDPNNDTLIIKNVDSKYKKNIPPKSRKTESIYFNFKYAYLKYDPFRNCFYRIAIHNLDDNDIKIPKKANAVAFTSKLQNWSIIVADEEVNMLCEKLINASDNFYTNILVTKTGIGLIHNDSAENGANITKTIVKIVKE
jgi:hypothetical protein